ncbi:MAG: S41 family peptidase [Calditrichia bacterium]
MFNKKFQRQFALLLVLLTVMIWLLNSSFAGNEQLYFKTDKGLYYLKQVYETISRNYVDEVDPEGLSKSAIKGIVEELDPYTVFFEQKGSENLQIITKGKYGGVGMEIGKREGKITVISPIDNTPAQRAGLRAGDVITKIDGESTEDMSLETASSKLRGKVGTRVVIEIQRPGFKDPIPFTLTREEIILKDVTYADFIEPGTAFIRLTSFSDKAAKELREAVRKLQKKGTIERVILDLRGNPGGLLNSAVEVANVFIPKGELIVITRGTHEQENKFLTSEQPLLPHEPLVVLVDGGSASASEIVAGAIQDLDRGIIVGSPTFGKGLVQQVYPVDKINDVFLKITTAKYYIPSGRCIQKEDYKKNKQVFLDIDDTTQTENNASYKTRNGRPVYGGGGIKPDIEADNGKNGHFLLALWAKGYPFRFSVEYLASHPELKSQEQVVITDEILNDFRKFLEDQQMDFEIEGEAELKNFLKIAREEEYSDDIIDLVTVAVQKLKNEKEQQFDRHIEKIREILDMEFAEKIKGSEGRIAAGLKYDQVLASALKVLKDSKQYNQILAVR